MLTTSNTSEDTSYLTYNTGYNYVTNNDTSSWNDMADSMRYTILNKPNIFVYTVEEAEADSKPTGNTFKLRYK